MKYEIREQEIVRVEDNKTVATIEDGEVKPTAPAYYKIKDELEALLEGGCDTQPAIEEEAVSDSSGEKEARSEVDKASTEAGEAPVKTRQLGSKTPGYPTWLHKTDPELAKKTYEGRNVPEYEALIK